MTKPEKLLEKLRGGTIDGPEVETLLGKLGFRLVRQKGSHATWSNGNRRIVLVAGRRDMKPYQIRELQELLL